MIQVVCPHQCKTAVTKLQHPKTKRYLSLVKDHKDWSRLSYVSAWTALVAMAKGFDSDTDF